MKPPFRIAFAAFLATLALLAQAQQASQPRARPPGVTPVEDVPPPPTVLEDGPGPGLEPVVSITAKGKDRVEEYRVKGKLYKMRVVPAEGAPYWLVDPKGDGNFARVDGPAPNIAVPTWVIFEW